ncbi:hypothetical protein PORCAN_739 [Porphyromonas crevioricanis JCM 13913]|nr:hypothetical protein PORCAN_739 [Porphyromonas crevioricanis JCM 13913]
MYYNILSSSPIIFLSPFYLKDRLKKSIFAQNKYNVEWK